MIKVIPEGKMILLDRRQQIMDSKDVVKRVSQEADLKWEERVALLDAVVCMDTRIEEITKDLELFNER